MQLNSLIQDFSTLSARLRINWLYPLKRGHKPPKRGALGMILIVPDGETLVLEILRI